MDSPAALNFLKLNLFGNIVAKNMDENIHLRTENRLICNKFLLDFYLFSIWITFGISFIEVWMIFNSFEYSVDLCNQIINVLDW
jgi:hypothetical protein